MKDSDFEEFKKNLDEYIPIIPDSVLDYYMQKSGITSSETNVKKMISLLSHKFISDVCGSAFQYHKLGQKNAQKDKRFSKDKKPSLQVVDVEKALEEVGINVNRPHYYM
ncbi:transcription initiation factor TFIID subunit 10 (TAF10) [Vairimorpha necatrix]|uniref:Transcription initiation factor TFIID subunit 10 (TAF10) n=1 Tax=Vairimorpha necatrix TaxID=6039 RepID=A0AAX4J8L5_9MICR